jgi:hypothetical protein
MIGLPEYRTEEQRRLDQLLIQHYLVWLAFTAELPIKKQPRYHQLVKARQALLGVEGAGA